MGNKSIGALGGMYQTRLMNRDGTWTPWLNLGGGLKTDTVEVKLVNEFNQAQWSALLDYLVAPGTDRPAELLQLWRAGKHEEIRQGWPGAPAAIFKDEDVVAAN